MESSIKERKLSNYTGLPVIIGVFIGTIIYLIMYHNKYIIIGNGLDDYGISGVLGLTENILLFYILRKRIGQFLLYLTTVSIFSYNLVTTVFCLLFGIYYGISVTGYLMKFGIKSSLFLFFCFFPHYLLYFISICLFGIWFNSKDGIKLNNEKTMYFIAKILLIILFLAFAIIWEVFFQKNILNFFTNI